MNGCTLKTWIMRPTSSPSTLVSTRISGITTAGDQPVCSRLAAIIR